jgi:hypothetical protein
MAQKKVEYTYRARLTHLEPDGEPVTDDFGDEVTEDVIVKLSWPVTVTKRQSPGAVDALRAAARMAVRNANRGALIKREFDVQRVEIVSSRTFRG